MGLAVACRNVVLQHFDRWENTSTYDYRISWAVMLVLARYLLKAGEILSGPLTGKQFIKGASTACANRFDGTGMCC